MANKLRTHAWILLLLAAALTPQTPVATSAVFGKISGRVIDAGDGRPVVGLTIELLRNEYDDEGIERLRVAQAAVTDDRGEYEILNVVPNPGYYVATAATPVTIPNGNSRVYLRTYYPGAFDASRAGSVSVSPEQEVSNLNFLVVPSRLVTLRGRMIDALNVRQPHLSSITLLRRDAVSTDKLSQPITYVNKDDTFELRQVPPGAYYLIGRRIDDEPNRSSAVLSLEVVDRDIDNIEVIAAEGHQVSGRVRSDNDNAKLLGVQLALRPLSGRIDVPGAMAGLRPDDGSFTLVGLPSGEYRLSVPRLPSGYYIESARLGQIDLLEKTVFLRGVVTEALEIVLSGKGGRITGTVVGADGKAVTASTVTLVPGPHGVVRPDLYKNVRTDPNGRFILSGIAPGEYEVYAWESFTPNSYYDRPFMNRFKDRAYPLRVTAGSSNTVKLSTIELP